MQPITMYDVEEQNPREPGTPRTVYEMTVREQFISEARERLDVLMFDLDKVPNKEPVLLDIVRQMAEMMKVMR